MARSLRDALTAAGMELPREEKPAEPDAPNPDSPSLFGVEAIEPGVIVLRLDPIALLEDDRVTYTQDPPVTRIGPFVCVSVEDDGEQTTWSGLTRKHRLHRMEIEPGWRIGGGDRWRTERQFLTDGASLWHGPKDAFAAASWRETFNDLESRARLTEVGLDAVRRKIDAAWRRRQPASNAHSQSPKRKDRA
jgi:hypothetical protein